MSRKVFTGNIISVKMQRCVVVGVQMPKKHKIYGKSLKATKKFLARNDTDAKIGDLVKIEEHKPFSKNCSWIVLSKVEEKKKSR